MSSTFNLILFAIAGGVLPALIWLFFWLKEDSKNPEPRSLLTMAFISGMLVVPIVLPFQQIVETYVAETVALTFLLWASLEEVFKFGICYIVALRKKENNEPIDYVIYLLTVALGFAALENILFISNPILSGDILDGVITGNLRFVGASLLHVISSAAIGVMGALAFYKSKAHKVVYILIGIVISIILHTTFNLFIISDIERNTLVAFGFVWVFVVILILFFERIKRIYPFKKQTLW